MFVQKQWIAHEWHKSSLRLVSPSVSVGGSVLQVRGVGFNLWVCHFYVLISVCQYFITGFASPKGCVLCKWASILSLFSRFWFAQVLFLFTCLYSWCTMQSASCVVFVVIFSFFFCSCIKASFPVSRVLLPVSWFLFLVIPMVLHLSLFPINLVVELPIQSAASNPTFPVV